MAAVTAVPAVMPTVMVTVDQAPPAKTAQDYTAADQVQVAVAVVIQPAAAAAKVADAVEGSVSQVVAAAEPAEQVI